MAENNNDPNGKKTNQALGIAVRIGLQLILVLLLVILVQCVISKSYDFGYNLFAAPAMSSPPGREVVFTVENGESTTDIIDELAKNGLIRDKFSFRCQIIFYDKLLMPGKYSLNTSMTSREILNHLNDGPGSTE